LIPVKNSNNTNTSNYSTFVMLQHMPQFTAVTVYCVLCTSTI